MIRAVRWTGRFASVAGMAAWSLWLGWRISSLSAGPVGLVILALEVTAVVVSAVLTAALWASPARSWSEPRPDLVPDVFAALLDLHDLGSAASHGSDDTGEVARAKRAVQLLDPRHRTDRPSLATTAWALVAVEGIRRMVFVVVLVAVLLSGWFPFELPRWPILASLVGGQLLLAIGHWLLSGGALRPGTRLRWSMASVGAGFGDGVSRTGLPIRWTATMATMVVLNLAVSLRGFSDRWTHGLGPMPRDQRVAVMVVSWWLVIVGFAALRTLPKPSLGFYGATRRLEETSTRRLALGTTLAVALVGFVAGVLPGGLPA